MQYVPDSRLHARRSTARAAYDSGDYGRTIALLSHAKEIDGADTDTQVAAHKLLAFSYCVTNRITPCRAEFSKLLDLNPRFDLSPAEKGIRSGRSNSRAAGMRRHPERTGFHASASPSDV